MFTIGALRLSEFVDRLYTKYLEAVNLEWDSDELTTSPSFVLESAVYSSSDTKISEIVKSVLNASDEKHEEYLDSQEIIILVSAPNLLFFGYYA